ncbi:MAG TPA: sugar ABC transporter permease [Chloroflexota bacterium]|nr:sugar ABC transporter permease [Chloroflexota bacterium]
MTARPDIPPAKRVPVSIGRPRIGRRRVRPSAEFLMLLPALVVLAALSLYPFFYLIWMSFSNITLIGGISTTFVGLQNWQTLFNDPQVWGSWLTTVEFVGGILILEMVLGIAVALAISALGAFRNLVLTLVILPMFLAPVVVGLLGLFLTNSTYGLYAYLLHSLGLFNNSDILGSTSSALPAVMLMDVWEWTPLIVLIVAAGISALPKEPLESANVDGANAVQRLRYVVLPLLRPTILVALLIRSMDAIRYYDIIWVTTAGGPADSTKIIPIRLYETAFRFFNLGYAAAIGLSMLVVTIILGRLFVGFMTRGDVNVVRDTA